MKLHWYVPYELSWYVQPKYYSIYTLRSAHTQILIEKCNIIAKSSLQVAWMHHNSPTENTFSCVYIIHILPYLWLAPGRRAVVKLNVTVPAVAMKSNSVPVSLNNEILGANNARTKAAIEAIDISMSYYKPSVQRFPLSANTCRP